MRSTSTMTRAAAVALAGALAFGAAACSEDDPDDAAEDTGSDTAVTEPASTGSEMMSPMPTES